MKGDPWITRNLMDTFETAKRAAITKMQNIQSSYLPTGWIPDDLARMHKLLFGDGEPWPSASNITVRPWSRFSLGATSRA